MLENFHQYLSEYHSNRVREHKIATQSYVNAFMQKDGMKRVPPAPQPEEVRALAELFTRSLIPLFEDFVEHAAGRVLTPEATASDLRRKLEAVGWEEAGEDALTLSNARRATTDLCRETAIETFGKIHKFEERFFAEGFMERYRVFADGRSHEKSSWKEIKRTSPDAIVFEHIWTHPSLTSSSIHFWTGGGRFTDLHIVVQLGAELRQFASEAILTEAVWRALKKDYKSVDSSSVQMVDGYLPIDGRDGLSIRFIGLLTNDYFCNHCTANSLPMSPVNLHFEYYEQMM